MDFHCDFHTVSYIYIKYKGKMDSFKFKIFKLSLTVEWLLALVSSRQSAEANFFWSLSDFSAFFQCLCKTFTLIECVYMYLYLHPVIYIWMEMEMDGDINIYIGVYVCNHNHNYKSMDWIGLFNGLSVCLFFIFLFFLSSLMELLCCYILVGMFSTSYKWVFYSSII